jgi:predicted oxidoreductase
MPIFTEITPKADLEKHFLQAKSLEKNYNLYQMWDPNGYKNRKNSIKHYEYSKEYIIWSVENSLKIYKQII